jgi:putative tricarboxylic transport membrane protein
MTGFSLDPAVIIAALVNVLEPWNLLMIVAGVLGGIIIGIIPGLGVVMAIGLLIPVTFTMAPEVGMSLLVAVFVGGVSGSCVTAILIRMPGTPSSVATLIDGFPMAQKGEAGRALGNAVVASFFGTIISGVLLVLLAPLLAAFALKFHFAEYVAVTIFAITAVAALTGSTVSRGLITGLLGLLFATFGLSREDGMPRFHFGITEMTAGIGLLPALIGLFAVSQVMHDALKPDTAKEANRASIGRALPSFADMAGNIVNYIRSGLIGTFVGVIPALGAGPAGLIAYAQARNASKTPERFGKGEVAGVIAAETANNATIGGALIIMLTLGIPGDPATAVLIGGLMIHGLQPGPQLFLNNPEIIYAVYFSVFFASLAMMVALLLFMKPLSYVAFTPKRILLPLILTIAAAGVYAIDNRVFDIGVMCAFGIIGYILERLRYPLPPLVLGLVLGPLLEGNFRKMLGQYGDAWPLVTQPIALGFILLSIISIGFSIYRHRTGGALINARSNH